MKVMICGKGGSGKSTITALLAKALKNSGKTVLVVDTDESNLCLHRLLGARMPEVLMEAMGGRKEVKEKLHPSFPHSPEDAFLKDPLTFAELPTSCLADADGIKLLVVGKIKEYGEGCACMIGSISKAVLSRLREEADEVVLIDAEAGLEHFGRRVDAGCDLVLAVVDPSFESLAMAGRIRKLAEMAGVQAFFILNKVEESAREVMFQGVEAAQVIAVVPRDNTTFLESLHGRSLSGQLREIETICRFITSYKKPEAQILRL
jgi:CO dehydrogenase maturation factor